MSKGFWGIVAVIVLAFIGVVAINSNKSDSSSSSGNKNSSSLTQHVIGKGSTGVTLVEYGDYQCPYCEQYYSTVKAIQAEYNDKIFFQFRNFPLTANHPNAFAAARAAEAADLQSKFWEMHDTLYEPANYQQWTQSSNPNPYFDTYAKQLKLDVAKFKKDFASSVVNDRINADMAEGNRLKNSGTPTFFIDGKKTEIANSLDAFHKVLDTAISQKTQTAQ